MNTSDPFDVLLDLERRTVNGPIDIAELDQAEKEWVGVGFRVGDSKLITSMSDVKEILDLPEITMVPGVKSWVVGVANVRGNLLPIMDLKGFLLGDDIKQRHKGRVIVIDYKGFNTGLVVEEIYGMRHFRKIDITLDAAEVDENISPYIEHVYKQGDEHWPVFNFNKMTQDERFAQATL
ncbi:MAG: chemotaxis protein CheW [Gammaproteobacteria bacterium]|jgi:twitching motility protein PilI|nr:chemotaxis protein CheW [Gammaproteobacteria bacterium]